MLAIAAGDEEAAMPSALRFGPHRLFFWSKENNEPRT